ncbi:MAG: rubrerythrin family protein, partial [Spirochaetales bacterium]
ELKDGRLVVMLEKALANEFAAHFKYRLMAEEAFAKYGPDNPSLAKLFTALADSEYRHAKNHYFILNKFANLEKCLAESIKGENFEVHTMYREYMEYADSSGHGLAKYTFFDALEAEKVHEKLLASAAAGKADPAARYFTCTSCGYTFAVEKHPQRCPVCGAPHDKITEVA